MFYPVYFLLTWLMSCFQLQQNPPATQISVPHVKCSFPMPSAADSLIFNELVEKMQQIHSETSPEKIYLHLDRTLFQPGETVWVAAYLRNADDLMPSRKSQILYIELYDPRGALIEKKELLALDGSAACEFDLHPDWAGGQYQLKAYTNWSKNFSEEFVRSITLQKVVLPHLNLKLEFEKKAHGAGDEVVARYDVQTLDNQSLGYKKVKFSVSLEGEKKEEGECQTDANGRAWVKFRLPENLATVDALLNVTVEHAGQTEAISRAIPIVLNKIDVQFLPEGGQSVLGLPCRMAFKATNEFGKPADVEGEILDKRGRVVTHFSSFHDGMGTFDFVPTEIEYMARLTRPKSHDKTAPIFKLPAVLPHGVVMQVQVPATLPQKSLRVAVASTTPQKMYLVGSSRDKVFYFKQLEVGASLSQVEISVDFLPIGITRWTVFDENKIPQAERLAFLHRDRNLQVNFHFDKQKYLPREAINLKLQVRDHLGKPVQGQFSLAVSDENQLTFADDRQGHLLASLLLEQDLRGKIENPNFYFDTTEKKSLPALDLLMQTHGWRRFEWQQLADNQKFTPQYPAEKAVVAGTFFNSKMKGKKNVHVKLLPDGPSQRTDREGKFSFENVDLSKFNALDFEGRVLIPLINFAADMKIHDQAFYQNNGYSEWWREYLPDGTCQLQGTILDDEEREPLIGATVKVMQNGKIVKGCVTNIEGNFKVQVPAGVYQVECSYTGYRPFLIPDIKIEPKMATCGRVFMPQSPQMLEEVKVIGYTVPLIAKDATSYGQTLTSEQIRNLPTRSIAASSAVRADEVSVKGSRSGNIQYFIDGERVSADRSIAVQEVVVLGQQNGKDFPMAARAHIEIDRPADKFYEREAKRAAHPQYVVRQHSSQQHRRNFVRARAFFVPNYAANEQATTARDDFRTTIFWQPQIKTDQNGRAEVQFFASDALTNFRATLEGIGAAGQVAHSKGTFFVQKPFSVSLKTPPYVIAGDVLHLPIIVSNPSDAAAQGQLLVDVPPHFSMKNQLPNSIQLGAGETKILYAIFEIGTQKTDNQKVRVKIVVPDAFEDAVEIVVPTHDRGYPVRMVVAGNRDQNQFTLPMNDVVEGTVSANLTAYPNLLDDILKGMERMLRQPNGCFEQVSSSNYPNLLVLDLLRTTGRARPDIEQKAMELLKSGYEKLAGYECQSGGFDWYGRDPGHEGLSAYGLLQFRDMQNVYPIDNQLIKRTLKWLESRRDGNGGWKKREDHLHSWSNEILPAYLAWAVVESGFHQKFLPEIESAANTAWQSGDAYQLALLANVFAKMQDPRQHKFAEKLLEMQQTDGSWMGKSRSITASTGKNLQIETTALAVLALLKMQFEGKPLVEGIQFIISSKNECGYGSTQSTVLAMKALVAFAKIQNANTSTGTLVLNINGREAARHPFSKMDIKPLEIKGLEKFFTEKNNRVEVFFTETGSSIPFDMEIKYATRQPQNAEGNPLRFSTKLQQTDVKVGETVRLTAKMENMGNDFAASPMMVVGIPAGLTLQTWQLKQILEEKRCDFYELWDGFAVFHFEKLAPGEYRQIDLDLRADLPGAFEAPASQAFLYYENDKRIWDKPARVVVH